MSTALNLADAQLYYGTTYDPTLNRIGDAVNTSDFSFPEIVISSSTATTVEIDFYVDPAGHSWNFSLLSMNAAGNPDTSSQYELHYQTLTPGTQTISVTLQPGVDQFDTAVAAGETRVLVDMFVWCYVTGIRYTVSSIGPTTAPAPNDNFANATVITGNPSTYTVPVQGNTVETGEPYRGLGKTAWWRYDATEDTMARFDGLLMQSGSAAYISVYTGSSLTTLTEVTYSSSSTDSTGATVNLPDLEIPVTAGTTYWVQMSANQAGLVDYTLRASTRLVRSQVIYCSSDDTDVMPPSTQVTGTLWPAAQGTIDNATFEQRDLLTTYATGSLSDTVNIDDVGFANAFYARYPGARPAFGEQNSILVRGRQNDSPGLPVGAAQLTVRIHASGSADVPVASGVSLQIYANPGDPGNETGTAIAYLATIDDQIGSGSALPASPQETSTTRHGLSNAAATIAAINARRVLLRWSGGEPAPDYTLGHVTIGAFYVEYHWLEQVPLDGSTDFRVRTWVRENQRGDKAGAAMRTVQNNSQQNSRRNVAFR